MDFNNAGRRDLLLERQPKIPDTLVNQAAAHFDATSAIDDAMLYAD